MQGQFVAVGGSAAEFWDLGLPEIWAILDAAHPRRTKAEAEEQHRDAQEWIQDMKRRFPDEKKAE